MITDQLLALLPLDRQGEDAPGGDLEVSLRSVGGHQLTGLQGGEAAAPDSLRVAGHVGQLEVAAPPVPRQSDLRLTDRQLVPALPLAVHREDGEACEDGAVQLRGQAPRAEQPRGGGGRQAAEADLASSLHHQGGVF